MGRFDKYNEDPSRRYQPIEEDAKRPAPPISGAVPGSRFDKYNGQSATAPVALGPNDIDWSKFNQPSGEARASTYNSLGTTEVTRRGIANVLDAIRSSPLGTGTADPYASNELARKLIGVAGAVPIVGSAMAAGDIPHHISTGQYGQAALDTLAAAAPAIAPRIIQAYRAARGVPAIPMADTPIGVRDRSFLPPRQFGSDQYNVVPGRTATGQNITGAGPTTLSPFDELQQSAKAGYGRVTQSPVLWHPNSLNHYIGDTVNKLGSGANPHIPQNAPEIYDLLGQWYNANAGRTKPVTALEWDAFRRQLRNLPGESGVAGGKAADLLEQYMHSPPPGGLVRGTQGELDSLRSNLEGARSDYRAFATAKEVEGRLANAQSAARVRRADPGDATRLALGGLANTNAGRNAIFGAKPDEIAAIRRAAEGPYGAARVAEKAGDVLGNWRTAPVVTGAVNTAGAVMGLDPITTGGASLIAGAVPKALSIPFKSIATGAETKAGQDVVDLIRQNSNLYRQRNTLPGSPPSPYSLTIPGHYTPPPGEAPIPDPFAMQRDAVAYALLPKLQQQGGDIASNIYEGKGNAYAPPTEPPAAFLNNERPRVYIYGDRNMSPDYDPAQEQQ